MNTPPRTGFAVLLAILLGACGGGGGGGTPVNSTPSISNLAFAPASALQGDGNGSITVTGTVTFADAGGDLSTLHLTTPQGQSISQAISGASGQTSGTIQAAVTVSTATLGHFTFTVYVTDAMGLSSNSLSGSFDVNPNSTAMNWTPQTLPVPSGSAIMLKRVRWSGSLFVAVGDSIFTSPDAVTWTERPVGLSSILMDATWTGSQFIAVGDGGALLTSVDGSTWTPRSVPAGIVSPVLYGVAASTNRMVVVGKQSLVNSPTPDTGLILTSTDGVTWTEVPAISSILNAVAWSGSEFVAVGDAVNQPIAKAVALTSPDGIAWTSHDMGTATLLVPADIAWNGSRFVVVGSGGGAATSTDGGVWQESGVGAVGTSYAIGWSGQGFLACGIVYCYTSSDGIQWSGSVQLPGIGPAVYGLTWGDSKWAAVGGNSLVLTSP
jgi:hypothetical protein